MLIDMRHDFMRYWPKINLLHDESVDRDSIQDLVNGLEREYVYGADPPEVTVFHMKDPNNAISVSDHSSCMTKSGPEMSVSHLMEHLVLETDRKFFVVIGKSKMIEKAVEEVRLMMLFEAKRDLKHFIILCIGVQQIHPNPSQTLAVRFDGFICKEEKILEEHRTHTGCYGNSACETHCICLFSMWTIVGRMPVQTGN